MKNINSILGKQSRNIFHNFAELLQKTHGELVLRGAPVENHYIFYIHLPYIEYNLKYCDRLPISFLFFMIIFKEINSSYNSSPLISHDSSSLKFIMEIETTFFIISSYSISINFYISPIVCSKYDRD